jgi:hypothetical protein
VWEYGKFIQTFGKEVRIARRGIELPVIRNR